MKCNQCGNEVMFYEATCKACGADLTKRTTQKKSFTEQLKSAQHQPITPKTTTKPNNTNTSSSAPAPSFTKTFNFNNIGAKFQGFAKLFCWIGISLVWFVCAIMFLISLFSKDLIHICWIWPVIAILLPFVIWISSWALFAFGHLIENDDKKTESLRVIADNLNQSEKTK